MFFLCPGGADSSAPIIGLPRTKQMNRCPVARQASYLYNAFSAPQLVGSLALGPQSQPCPRAPISPHAALSG